MANEMARGQIVNLRAFDGGIELPIELLQGFEFAEGGALFASLDLTLRTDIEFILEDQFQELVMGQLMGSGFLDSSLPAKIGTRHFF